MTLDFTSFVLGGLCVCGALVVLFLLATIIQAARLRRLQKEREQLRHAAEEWKQ